MRIQLQRRGVSHSLQARFAQCPHGESHYVEIQDYQGRAWLATIHYRNCAECEGHRRRGQAHWSNRHCFLETHTVDAAKQQVLNALAGFVKEPVEFSPFIEAYMAYSEHDHRVHPCVRDDRYVLACSYEPGTDTIRHEPTNVCLIAFDGPMEAVSKLDPAAEPYRCQIEKAYREFTKEHNQRMGEKAAKNWLAWLLSEYIKELPGQSPIVALSPTRS